jgi:hypothetical protein
VVSDWRDFLPIHTCVSGAINHPACPGWESTFELDALMIFSARVLVAVEAGYEFGLFRGSR